MKISNVASVASEVLNEQGHKNHVDYDFYDAFIVITESTVYPTGRYKVNINFSVTPLK